MENFGKNRVFDIRDYEESDWLMICESEEDAKTFLEYLDLTGKRWSSGYSYLDHTHYPKTEQGHIAYRFNRGTYITLNDGVIPDGFYDRALYFKDFVWGDEVYTSEIDDFLCSFILK